MLLAAPGLLAALDQVDLVSAGQWFVPLMPRPDVRVGASTTFEGAADVRDQDATVRRRGVGAGATGRVWHDDQSEAWVRVIGTDVQVDSDARLPVTGALPDHLQDLRVGGFVRRIETDGTIWGFDGEISSPSDQPFAHGRDVAVSATAFARLPAEGRDGWLLMLRYDRTRTLLPGVPLPTAAYQFVRPGLMVTIGAPVLVIWRPADDWSLNASYFPIDVGQAAVSWIPGTPKDAPPWRIGHWLVQGGGQIAYDNWFRADRSENDDRLTFRTVRTFVAGEWRPLPGNSVRLALGRILLNEIYETQSWSTRAENRIRLDSAWYGTLGVVLAY
jgi:hypothetical protein